MSIPDSYWTLIEPYWEVVSIYEGPEIFLKEFQKLPVCSKNLFAAHWLQSEVCNGGFEQFCCNPTGVLATEAKAGFEALEMPQVAELIQIYLSYWGDDYPREREARNSQWERMGTIDADGFPLVHSFEELDEPFFELIESENGGFDEAADKYAAKMRNV